MLGIATTFTGRTTALRAMTLIGLMLMLSGCPAADRGPDLFGIYTATLDGREFTRVIVDPVRQMTHARVSPDHQWVAFTRYNKKGFGGLAEESGGYAETEIVVARIDGSNVETVVPPKRGVVASNPSWADDGRGLFYVSTDNPQHSPVINVIDLATHRIKRVPTPRDMQTTDPNHVDNRIVFPVKGDRIDSLWIMNLDGSGLRRLTHPAVPDSSPKGPFHYGDYDPKLSPDARKVAFMRYYGGESWRIFVVDVKTGREHNLSNGDGVDGLPEWSSDGRKLLFWHVDRKNPRAIGIYTMNPDGSNRRMVPVPRGYLHGHPSFFPGDGSSPRARIVYVAKKMSQLP